jgi:hypothetical protein
VLHAKDTPHLSTAKIVRMARTVVGVGPV